MSRVPRIGCVSLNIAGSEDCQGFAQSTDRTMPQTWIRGCQIAQMSVKQPYRLHGQEMQASAWPPANSQDIDLAARLRSNERCRSRRIQGMAARRIRQRCSPTAIVTDHAWPQNLDSVDGCERTTMKVLRPTSSLAFNLASRILPVAAMVPAPRRPFRFPLDRCRRITWCM